MEVKFKNTYKVGILNPSDCTVELALDKFNTVQELENALRDENLEWDEEEGCFTDRFDDSTFFVISEKSNDCISDWCHGELERYMNDNLDRAWIEDGESIFWAPGLTLEEAFNQLKRIDGVELELEAIVEPGVYINQYIGPIMYGEAWEQIKTISEAKTTYSVDLGTDTSEDFPKIESIEFVDWDAVDKMLNSRK